MIVGVYVPTGPTPILPRSAIVGTRSEADENLVTIDYEGNRYHAPTLATFEARLIHAAGRHVARYPTTARMVVHLSVVKQVGTYDTDEELLDTTDMPALTEWLGIEMPS